MTFRALAKVVDSMCMMGTKGGRQRESPLLALILYFIAQVKDDLPVLTGQGLICRLWGEG